MFRSFTSLNLRLAGSGLRKAATASALMTRKARDPFLQTMAYSTTTQARSGGVDWHGTTIVCVRKDGKVCMAGDGQVSQGSTVVKGNARKVRRIGDDILVGFAGSTADAMTLLDRLEKKLGDPILCLFILTERVFFIILTHAFLFCLLFALYSLLSSLSFFFSLLSYPLSSLSFLHLSLLSSH